MNPVVLTVLAALAVTSCATPVLDANVELLELGVANCFGRLEAIAANSNSAVQTAISAKLDFLVDRTNLEDVQGAIQGQDWIQARKLLGEVKGTLDQALGELRGEISRLSPRTAPQIRREIGVCFQTTGRSFGDIFEFLSRAQRGQY